MRVKRGQQHREMRKSYSLLKGKFTDLLDFKMMNMTEEKMKMLFSKLNIRLFLKVKCLEWASHVWRAAESLTRNVLTSNPPKKQPKERPRRRWFNG